MVDITNVGVLWNGVVVDIDDGDAEPLRSARDMLTMAMRLERGERRIIYAIDAETERTLSEDMAYTGMPLTGNREKQGYCVIASPDGKFYELSANIAGGAVCLWDIGNLLRATARDIMRTYDAHDAMGAIREYLRHMRDANLLGMTIGGVAMRTYIDGDYVRFLRRFPRFDDADMRQAYLGGFVMSKPGRYKGCISLDVNSMYPDILRNEDLPYGEPERFDGAYERDPAMPLHIDTKVVRLDLKPDGHPTFTSDAFDVYRYGRHDRRVTSTHGYVALTLTDVDWELVRENYRCSVYREDGGWKFAKSRGYFTDYVDTWFHVKQSAKGVERATAKLMLNSLVGKFGSYANGSGLAPVLHDGMVSWEPCELDGNGGMRYSPVAMYVNAYGRRRLTDALRLAGGRAVYADTDGMILAGTETPKGIDVSDRLGAWKIDYRYTDLSILGNQRYSGRCDDGSLHTVMAGTPMSEPIPPESFARGGAYKDATGAERVL